MTVLWFVLMVIFIPLQTISHIWRMTTMKKNIRAIFMLPALLSAVVLPLEGALSASGPAVALPPLDAATPAVFETASFGLG